MRWRFKSNGVVAASLFAICTLTATSARSQLYDNRVVDKAFEENALFFKSGLINPYGISGFGDAASGFIQHPLLDLQQNPALAASDSIGTVFGYLDFRRSAPTQPEYYGYGGCPYCRGVDLAVADIRYPYYAGYEREALRPLLGAALLGRPFGAESPFVTGVSYQLIFRDELYYRVPFDIYRSAAAFDFTGSRQAEVSDPFVNGSTGENAMRTSGHLVNVHAATQSGPLSAGARLGLARQNIDGSVGSQNSWGGGSTTDRSLWSDLEERTQSYDHLDVELGIGYAMANGVRVGVSAGALFGNAKQELARTDTSFYSDGLVPPTQYRSEYVRGGHTSQSWDRDGTAGWAGAHATFDAGNGREVYLNYRASVLTNDLLSQSAIRDSTDGMYTGGTYGSSSSSSLFDDRSGNGERTGSGHHIAGGVRWDFGTRSRIHLGVDVNTEVRETHVVDNVVSFQHSQNDWTDAQQTQSYRYRLEGEQVLTWDLRSRSTAVTIPVYLTTRVSEHIALELGLNRRFDLLDLSDRTTVDLTSSVETVNGQITNRSGSREIYREPRVKESDVSTAFLAGVTVSPSAELDIRVLLAPVHRESFGVSDLQWRWWVGFELSPSR